MVVQKKIKWGIIGCGNIARKFASDLTLVEGAELFAVASRSIEKAQKFAKKYQATVAYGSYDELLLDTTVDIVYIATPHISHAEWSIKAMQYHKHVLCEKPLALNKKETKAIIKTSQQTNRFFMEGLWTRFNPSFIAVKKYIDSGKLGKISNINADFSFLAAKPIESRVFDLNLGGGALLDIGIYPAFIAYALLGIPRKIKATSTFHTITHCDIETSMVFEYENAQADLHCSFTINNTKDVCIKGAKGTLYLKSPWHAAQQYTLVTNQHKEVFKLPTAGFGFTYEIIECHRCIQNQRIESKRWSHQYSLELISLLDETRAQIGLIYPQEKA